MYNLYKCLVYLFLIRKIMCVQEHNVASKNFHSNTTTPLYERLDDTINSVYPATIKISGSGYSDAPNTQENDEQLQGTHFQSKRQTEEVDSYLVEGNHTIANDRRDKTMRKYEDYKEPNSSGGMWESIFGFLDSALEMILFPFYRGESEFKISNIL